jgi:hypothetical protein
MMWQVATFSTSDVIVLGGILLAFIAATVWLFVMGKRYDDAERRRSAQWLREYFSNRDLIRGLMMRWKGQGRLTDQRKD